MNSEKAGIQNSSVGDTTGEGAIMARSGGKERGCDMTVVLEFLRIKSVDWFSSCWADQSKVIGLPGDITASLVGLEHANSVIPSDVVWIGL